MKQGCGVGAGVVRSRRFLGGVGIGFLTTLGVGVGFFVRLRISNWIIFYIILLNWESLLKWYNLFWNFCWNRDFLLWTTISIDFNNQISFPLIRSRNFWKVGVGNFGKVGVGVGYFISDSANLIANDFHSIFCFWIVALAIHTLTMFM